ncbi:MAG: ABC transporter permease [Candidatus Paceibacterota bacterium]|jgi:putative ABC transport system permease protein
MKLTDIFRETFTSLSANKARTGLTMLGIVIGIASVIAMTAIGQGAQSSIQASIEGLGSNLIYVYPGVIQPGRGIVSSGRGSAQNLKSEDVDVLLQISGITNISPELQRRFQIISQSGNNTNTTVTGTTSNYGTVHNTDTQTGNFISEANERSLAKVAVLGSTTATDLFDEDDPINKTIRINKVNFKVIGILETKGGSGFVNPDDIVIVPLSTMQKVLAGADYLSSMSVAVVDKDQMAIVKQELTDALLRKHNVEEADFSVMSQADILSTLTQVIDTFTIFLASIAGISLLVGGIGIMNMMLTTVTERTREIGLRKAVGAKRRDINNQFLIEAIVLTFSGGLAGVILGWLVSFTITSLGIIKTQVSFSSVLLAFGVSTVIGIIFGYYPARRASKLNPIEALRYE